MKKIFAILFLGACLASVAGAENDDIDKNLLPKKLQNDAFVVSTDSESSSDSLNRISGQYDMGFSSPSQSYKSDHHYKPGPFSKASAEENAASEPSY